MVILPLRPWEAAIFASHDDGSLFREEAGDAGLVRPLGNGIMCPVCQSNTAILVLCSG